MSTPRILLSIFGACALFLWAADRHPDSGASLSAQPQQWRHGYALMKETGLHSGTLYPLLMRMTDQGYRLVALDGAAGIHALAARLRGGPHFIPTSHGYASIASAAVLIREEDQLALK